MTRRDKETRAACIRKSDNHFFLAVNNPFPKRSEEFGMLNAFVVGEVRILDEGSQVFVFSRDFGYAGRDPEKSFVAHAWDMVKEIGDIALDVRLEPVSQKVGPSRFLLPRQQLLYGSANVS